MSSIKAIMTLALITVISLAFIGCSEDGTAPLNAIDTAPPAAPAGLSMTVYNGAVALSWEANTTDADFANFVVQRTYHNDTTTLQTSTATSFREQAPIGLNVYKVYSVDLAGNASAVVSVQYDCPEEQIPDVDMNCQL